MKTFKQFLETVEAPRSEAERNFIKKHVVNVDQKVYPKKEVPTEKDETRDADYKDGEDAVVYETVDALVKEALLEGLNLKVGVLKFTDGTQTVVTRDAISRLEKVYASTQDKSGMEKEIKSSKDNFEALVALGD
jgi:phosphosulfolactate synthase (CoM biosynthesis protein A)